MNQLNEIFYYESSIDTAVNVRHNCYPPPSLFHTNRGHPQDADKPHNVAHLMLSSDPRDDGSARPEFLACLMLMAMTQPSLTMLLVDLLMKRINALFERRGAWSLKTQCP